MKSLVVLDEKQEGGLLISSNQQHFFPNTFVVPKKDFPQLRLGYAHIYNWHLAYGIEQASHHLSEDDTSNYLEAVSRLKSEKDASIRQMLTVSQAVTSGLLKWSENEESGGRTLKDWANEIKQLKVLYGAERVKDYRNKSGKKKAKFKDAAYDFLFKYSPKLAYIHKNNLNKKRLGGYNVLMETNALYNRDMVVNPGVLGFKEVLEKNALVNLALEEKVEILKVKLNNDFTVSLKFKNLTNEDLQYTIPRGQLFENAVYACKYQNLVVLKNYKGLLKGYKVEELRLATFCINFGYSEPNGGDGNLTIYKLDLIDKAYSSVKEMWKSLGNQVSGFNTWREKARAFLNFNSSWHKEYKTRQITLIVGGISILSYFLLM